MSQHLNPFIRGYQDLHVARTLLITYADDCPPAWRPLHASQAHLPDDEVARFPCIFCSDFALIDKGMPESLVEVLYLAGQADVRMLILDDDASVLDGLPLYEA